MRGEFVGVWQDTYREIWEPLSEHGEVPAALFSELYQGLAQVFKDPQGDQLHGLLLNDAIEIRQIFDRAIFISGLSIEFSLLDQLFDASGIINLRGSAARRVSMEKLLGELTGDPSRSADLLRLALEDLASDTKRRAEAKQRSVEEIVNDTERSREAFGEIGSADFVGEKTLVDFFESAFVIVDDIGGDELSNHYFNLLSAFIEKFSLRYDLRRPCTLCPTLTGIFASLVRSLNSLALVDQNVAKRVKDLQEAVQDLRLGQSEGRIANCVAKQIMLLEAIGAASAGVTGTDLAAICGQVKQWPHPAMKSSLMSLYGFTSDFPGLRHGTPSTGMLRDIDMRDLVAVSILLAGFTPYLSDQLDVDILYRGA